MKIAIIGHGFVGSAVEYAFSQNNIKIIDPKYNTSIELFNDFDPHFTFICVPTPMGINGEIDDKHIQSSLKSIAEYWPNTTVVIKSTVTPSVLKGLIHNYESLTLVYNPEFLTERAAIADFVNADFHVIGYDGPFAAGNLEALYKNHSACKPAKFIHVSFLEASYIKYAINSFLAMKIIFMNQLKDNVESDGLNANRVLNAIGTDPRIGYSHIRVPGFDGKPGYGGACFPKDVLALINEGDFTLLEKVHEINVEYRKNLELDDREKEQNVRFR